MIGEVAEVLALWDEGLASRMEVFARLFDLTGQLGVDRLVRELPFPWRGEFVQWMRDSFDNDLPLEHFVWLDRSPEPAGHRELITAAREWLRQKPRMTDDMKGMPDRNQLEQLLARYFDGAIAPRAVDDLLEQVAALLADEPRRRAQVRQFAPENQVSWGEAWREEYATRAQPTPLDHALMLAARSKELPPPRPHCPPAMVGAWDQVAAEDGRPPPDPRPRWELAADGGFRATGRMQRATRWCVHGGGGSADRLWLTDDSGVRRTIVISSVAPDEMELMSISEMGARVRFRRV